jgi:hypothetical protein
MFEVVRFRGNRKLHAMAMLRAEVPSCHLWRRSCELRLAELELSPRWLGGTDPLVLAG